ncbi:thiamine phosphate synthase [Bacillus aquiflavi]|uniref:Thiamine-phosphate synthase n=1 Tax=Bacillus aquiflavi TaxID=2672567 RepID=A0A6B3VXZ2_9BACI|nr:thiamine phosphate synthase [Bacillus aquiflavi]MBA4536778.1 thiamine phosphate synthase [Bacillus aquiflavi]NEY81145.1 thiamine phosphate synthase [Bacillus aquiflavi]UAC49706.1 thiamine phosphate synthase [Bacillus aquiflavi]
MSKIVNVDYQLYLVTPSNLEIDELCKKVEQAVLGGVTVVQLREKDAAGLEFYEKASKLKKMLAHYHVPLIINDRVDVALAVNADGVHIGQKDLPLSKVKALLPSHMLVGVSAKTIEEAKKAELEGADYLGIGAVFPTKTKQDANIISVEGLKQISAAVQLPKVAIGGITLENISLLQNTNINGVAVVSAIFQTESPKESAKQFKNLLSLN